MKKQSFKAKGFRQVQPVAPVSPAELRKQVVNYIGRVGTLGAKLQAAVWVR